MEVANRTGVGFISKDIGFSEWAIKWLEVYKKPDVDENTYIDTYMCTVVKHINPYFGAASLQDIKPIDIKNFYTSKQNMSESRLAKMRICLNGIFDTAINNDLCNKNPARGVTYISQAQKNQKRVFTDAEIEEVEKLAASSMPEIVLLLETGLRRGGIIRSTLDRYRFYSTNHICQVLGSYKKGRRNCNSFAKVGELSDKPAFQSSLIITNSLRFLEQ